MRWGQIMRIFSNYTPTQIMEAAGFPQGALKQMRNHGALVTNAITKKEPVGEMATMPQKPNLNEGLGKGVAIVTIEGIRQSFDLWRRKMGTKIQKWTIADIDKAILLLEPFAAFLESLRTMRQEKTARILR